jgi:ribosomal protein S18 acetylase RimI-like enzyme
MAIMHRNPTNGQPDVAVRAAQPGDLATVVALDAEATGMEKAAYWKERFSWYANGEKGRFFLVAERGDEMVGFIVGEIRAWEFGSPPGGWIFAVNVKDGERLHGLGTMLFDAICARFRKAGVQNVRTMLAKDNPLVISFFRSQGMRAGPFIQLEKRLDA